MAPQIGRLDDTNTTMVGLVRTMAEQHLAQASAIAGQAGTIADQNATIASLQTTVATLMARMTAAETAIAVIETAVAEGENVTATVAASQEFQAAVIATLQTNVTAVAVATALQSNVVADFCGPGDYDISSDTELELLAPHLHSCTAMRSLFIGSGISNTTALAEAFRNLRVVAHDLCIRGAINLATLDGVFPALRTVGGNLRISNNYLLATIGSSFGSLRSVGDTLMWWNNGQPPNMGSTAASRSFCASARAALCPTTNSRGFGNADDATACCNTYCATTTNC